MVVAEAVTDPIQIRTVDRTGDPVRCAGFRRLIGWRAGRDRGLGNRAGKGSVGYDPPASQGNHCVNIGTAADVASVKTA